MKLPFAIAQLADFQAKRDAEVAAATAAGVDPPADDESLNIKYVVAYTRIVAILKGDQPPPTLTDAETAVKPARKRHPLDDKFDPTEDGGGMGGG
jgi:hypothetical protein